MSLKSSSLYAESWNVAWRKRPKGSILSDKNTPFTVVKNSMRYWAADPFLIKHNNRVFIFSELYDYIRCRGIIGYCEIIDNKTTKWHPAIVESHHLSFPYIFEKNGEVFIVPESNYAKELCIYRATSFPDKWEKVEVIRNGVQYADTTFFSVEGHDFALTYNVKDALNPRLRILDLENEKADHDVNLSHVELRRPAGKIMNDEKMRCAQNCADDYGKGLIFYRFDYINGKFSEQEIQRVFPEEIVLTRPIYLDGMHTYNFIDEFEIVDIKTRRFNVINLLFRFIKKLH